MVIVFLSISQKLESASWEFGEAGYMVSNIGQKLGDADWEFRDAGCEVSDIGWGLGDAGQKCRTFSWAGFPKAEKLFLSKVILEVFMMLFWIGSYSLYILVVLCI